MENKIIEKSILTNWILKETISNYEPTPNYKILKGYRIFKILKFLRLNEFNSTNPSLKSNDYELHCILSDSNHSIIARISSSTIKAYERLNKLRITENSINTIIIVKDVKLEWWRKDRVVNELGSVLGKDFLHQLNSFNHNYQNMNRSRHNNGLSLSLSLDDDYLFQNQDNQDGYLNTLAIFKIDNDDEDCFKIYDHDQDKLNVQIRPIYFTFDYLNSIKPIKFKVEDEFDI